MQAFDYDVIVIGSGPAGYTAAVQACELGARVAIVERQETLGGITLLSGTIPSKTLREAIIYLRGVRQRPFYGTDFTEKKDITLSDLFIRVRKVVERRVATMEDQLQVYRDLNRIDVFRGYHATVDGPNSVHAWVLKNPMESINLKAEKIIIAAGSRPRFVPDIPIDNEVVFDSDSVFTLEFKRKNLPQSVIVVGAGVIGAEYGSAFAVLGCKVSLIQRDQTFLTFAERPIVDMLIRRMEDYGVEFVWGNWYDKIERVADSAERARVTLADGRVLEADAVIVASGREVATKVLGLEDVGVDFDQYGLIEVNELFQTSIPSIYAAGDVIGFPALASTSSEQGRMAANYALGRRAGGRRTLFPMCVYTIPEVAMVGYTRQQLEAKGIPYAMGVATYEEVTKAGIIGDPHGMLTLLFEPNNGHLLGVHIIGDQACELIHIGQAVLSYNGTIDYFTDNVFNFPTMGEAYKIAALNGVKQLARTGE
ncbi:MAG: Si-specific NAD(P)(+) transhydrogenase [Deltaproteobacteria bacterium]|nr:Si-specific NAD(P)(+) transhydrogenase [Deltaproteobacteria bacterium]